MQGMLHIYAQCAILHALCAHQPCKPVLQLNVVMAGQPKQAAPLAVHEDRTCAHKNSQRDRDRYTQAQAIRQALCKTLGENCCLQNLPLVPCYRHGTAASRQTSG